MICELYLNKAVNKNKEHTNMRKILISAGTKSEWATPLHGPPVTPCTLILPCPCALLSSELAQLLCYFLFYIVPVSFLSLWFTLLVVLAHLVVGPSKYSLILSKDT